MKKRSKRSAVVIASALAGLPLVRPAELLAQRPTLEKPVVPPVMVKGAVITKVPAPLKFAERFEKQPGTQDIVGIDNGRPVYQNARGEHFTLDPVTGDMNFLSSDAFAHFHEAAAPVRAGRPLGGVKWSGVKFGGGVTILGIDEAGHVVNRNARGEKFYLDPATGDMVFVM